jgi:hypothetical protein
MDDMIRPCQKMAKNLSGRVMAALGSDAVLGPLCTMHIQTQRAIERDCMPPVDRNEVYHAIALRRSGLALKFARKSQEIC